MPVTWKKQIKQNSSLNTLIYPGTLILIKNNLLPVGVRVS